MNCLWISYQAKGTVMYPANEKSFIFIFLKWFILVQLLKHDESDCNWHAVFWSLEVTWKIISSTPHSSERLNSTWISELWLLCSMRTTGFQHLLTSIDDALVVQAAFLLFRARETPENVPIVSTRVKGQSVDPFKHYLWWGYRCCCCDDAQFFVCFHNSTFVDEPLLSAAERAVCMSQSGMCMYVGFLVHRLGGWCEAIIACWDCAWHGFYCFNQINISINKSKTNRTWTFAFLDSVPLMCRSQILCRGGVISRSL